MSGVIGNEFHKVIVVGAAGVGKTTLLHRLGQMCILGQDAGVEITKTQWQFCGRTINAEFCCKTIKYAHQDSPFSPFFSNASAAIVMYSTMSAQSLRRVHWWIQEVRKYCMPGIPIILFSNVWTQHITHMSYLQVQADLIAAREGVKSVLMSLHSFLRIHFVYILSELLPVQVATSPISMMSRLVNVYSASKTKDLVTKSLHQNLDESCAVISDSSKLRVSLICPISKARIETPCRGARCTHVQCFDAASFIKLNSLKLHCQWICPICDKPAPFTELAIDELLRDIIKLTTDCDDVVFFEDGSWLPGNKVLDDVTIDLTNVSIIDLTSDTPSPRRTRSVLCDSNIIPATPETACAVVPRSKK